MNKERIARSLPGIPVAIVLTIVTIALTVVTIWYVAAVLAQSSDADIVVNMVVFILLLTAILVACFAFTGLTPVNPNESRALVLFGKYRGTLHEQGLQWVNPFTDRRRISIRVRNF